MNEIIAIPVIELLWSGSIESTYMNCQQCDEGGTCSEIYRLAEADPVAADAPPVTRLRVLRCATCHQAYAIVHLSALVAPEGGIRNG
jgi:hypothetical protein